MFLSRMEGMLGDYPVSYRIIPVLKKLRARAAVNPNKIEDSKFFTTSTYTGTRLRSREREVGRLFARLQNELRQISYDYADDDSSAACKKVLESLDCLADFAPVREGLLVEMYVASEFVADQIDAHLAYLVSQGQSLESGSDAEKLEGLAKTARIFARLRNRFSEFQKELDSILETVLRACLKYSIEASLNFDPLEDKVGCQNFIELFCSAVQQSVSLLSSIAGKALSQNDFETTAELCSCNVQLSNFLLECKSIIAELD